MSPETRELVVEDVPEALDPVLADAASELVGVGMLRLAAAVERARSLLGPAVQFEPFELAR